ncbi:MAG TPA: sigma-70 family RNA polymerase sigma factor [Puia sp.]|nr:sigma-70 family RNA polymerase sigma factor [Puia sp.]
MNSFVDPIQQEVDRLYKSHYGKMVATLLKSFQDSSLDMVEDLVQDAFAAALTAWRRDGIPSNAAGWIYTVCKNNGLNKIKKDKRTRTLALHDDGPVAGPAFKEPMPGEKPVLGDQSLTLLFACAHPDLSPKVQVVITLKYVANLKVEAIAKALGMGIDGVDKLLLRARKKIKEEKIFLKEPDPAQLTNRLPIVHKIIYLIFNEGYKPSTGASILQEDLCEEALLVTKALLDSKVGDGVTSALYALMLFNAARFKARSGSGGELLDLEEQDRSLWNQSLISLGCDYLRLSMGKDVSTYHCEAAIAYLHCTANDFPSTNWTLIASLYGRLLEMTPNPFVELNYAIALYYSGQKIRALDMLNALLQHPFLHQYYLLNATLGKLYLLEGNAVKAREFFEKTLRQPLLPPEKDFIRRMLGSIKEG